MTTLRSDVVAATRDGQPHNQEVYDGVITVSPIVEFTADAPVALLPGVEFGYKVINDWYLSWWMNGTLTAAATVYGGDVLVPAAQVPLFQRFQSGVKTEIGFTNLSGGGSNVVALQFDSDGLKISPLIDIGIGMTYSEGEEFGLSGALALTETAWNS